MISIIVEMKCPEHGLERFKVKVIKRFNIASNQIIPKFRIKPAKGELSLLYVGRSVSAKEAKNYLVDYFHQKGVLEKNCTNENVTIKEIKQIISGSCMKKRWMNKGVDLTLLITKIGNFFKERDFEAIKGQTPTGYYIFAEDSPKFKLDGYISVTIEGKPNDFIVKLELCQKEKRHSLAPILLTTMFFGGYPLIKRLKSEEDWIRLEKEFWNHVNNTITFLTNSNI